MQNQEKITPEQSIKIWTEVKKNLFDLLRSGDPKSYQKTLDEVFHAFMSSEFANEIDLRVKVVMLYQQLSELFGVFIENHVDSHSVYNLELN